MIRTQGETRMRQIRWIEGALLGLVLLAGLSCDIESHPGGQSTVAPTPLPSASSVAVSPAAPTAPPQIVGADDSVNEELRNYHRHHHGGVTMFISMAIDTLGLDEAKKAAVAKIQSDLRAEMAPTHDAEHDLLSVIADGIASGKIDTSKVDAAVEKVAAASSGIRCRNLRCTDSAARYPGSSRAGGSRRQGAGTLGCLAEGQCRRESGE